jgi:hypothetical protein
MLILLLVSLLSYGSAQQLGYELKLENLSIRVPSRWRLSNQTRDSIAIHVPLKNERDYRAQATRTPINRNS